MELTLLAGRGVVGLVLIGAMTVLSLWSASRAEVAARADHADALAKGAQPPSLHPKIALDRCIGSGSCVQVCPENDVLALLDGKAAVVNPTSCIGHGECLRACPVDAIELVLGSERRGVDIPLVDADFQTNVPGLYVVDELGGMGLVYNAMTQALQCVSAVVKAGVPPRDAGVHQLVIVGAGPAGLAASLAAKAEGLDAVTVDQESVGGTVLHYPRHKIVMTKPVKLPLYGPLRLTEVSKEALLKTWQDILDKTGIEVRTGVRVGGVTRGDDDVFNIATSAGPLRAHRVVLAMGRRGSPRKLGCPGEEQGKVTYRLLEPERYKGDSVLVVGGGDSAVEAACAQGQAGAWVHLSYRRDSFGRIKKKNQEKLDAAVAKDEVKLLMSSKVTQIFEERVAVEIDDAVRELPNDYVLVFAGGVLPTPFLEAAGVQVQTLKGEVYAPAN